VNVEYQNISKTFNIPLEIIHLKSREDMKKVPGAFPIHNLYLDGEFLTHEIQTVKRFEKLMAKRGLA
jgi:hypothetical protein